MGKPIAVVGDKVRLPSLDNIEAVILDGSSHKCDNKSIAVVGSTFKYYCKIHKTEEIGVISSGGKSLSDGKSVARDGDVGKYCTFNDGVVIASSEHVSD